MLTHLYKIVHLHLENLYKNASTLNSKNVSQTREHFLLSEVVPGEKRAALLARFDSQIKVTHPTRATVRATKVSRVFFARTCHRPPIHPPPTRQPIRPAYRRFDPRTVRIFILICFSGGSFADKSR